MEAIVATKTDLQYLREQVSGEIHALKVEMDSRFQRLELRPTVKLGAFLTIAVGLIVTLQQVLQQVLR